MKMRSSKSQAPSSKEGPNSKLQKRGAAWPASTWKDDRPQEAGLILRDAPPSRNSDARPRFDLEERTALFGENIVKFSKRIPRDPTNNRLIDQLVGCGASVGANYCEANESVSKKDFRNSIARCKKEVKETKLFLRLGCRLGTLSGGPGARPLSGSNRIAAHPGDHVPKMKLAIPSKHQTPSCKGSGVLMVPWILELGIYLEVGAWKLELSS